MIGRDFNRKIRQWCNMTANYAKCLSAASPMCAKVGFGGCAGWFQLSCLLSYLFPRGEQDSIHESCPSWEVFEHEDVDHGPALGQQCGLGPNNLACVCVCFLSVCFILDSFSCEVLQVTHLSSAAGS